MAKVAVVGAGGYLGGELLRLLSTHPSFELHQVVSSSGAGRPIGEMHPFLTGDRGLRALADPGAVDAEIAFLAQPAGEGMRTAPGLLERGIKVVDLGPDYRLPTPELYAAAYGAAHTDPDHLPEAVYGLTELFPDEIRSARLVANPGCYPTAALLALAPLHRAGALEGPIVVDAKSGTSGAGHAPGERTHHPAAALSVQPYGLPRHRHLPEMRSVLDRLGGPAPPIRFVPHLVPVVRGLLCSIYPSEAPAPLDAGDGQRTLEGAYAGSPFVHPGPVPQMSWALGSNHCYLSCQPVEGSTVLFSALDNLGKGGASQAIQNANLMGGLTADAGLRGPGFGV